MARRRGVGGVERRVSRSGEVTYRARYAMPDGSRYSRTLATKMDAEGWLAAERALIDRAPPKIRGASTARVQRVARPATSTNSPSSREHARATAALRLLAAFVGLGEGEALELRRTDVDGVTGRIEVTRKVDKNANPDAPGACSGCGRPISAPKMANGSRTVHVPPPFLTMLQVHLLEQTAPGPTELLSTT